MVLSHALYSWILQNQIFLPEGSLAATKPPGSAVYQRTIVLCVHYMEPSQDCALLTRNLWDLDNEPGSHTVAQSGLERAMESRMVWELRSSSIPLPSAVITDVHGHTVPDGNRVKADI